MASGGSGDGIGLQDAPTPGSEATANYTAEELMWIWDTMKGPLNNIADGSGQTEAQKLRSIEGSRSGGGTINAANVETIKRLRAQRDKEMKASNAASNEQSTLAARAGVPTATPNTNRTRSVGNGTRTAQSAEAVEQEMYSSFLGL